MKQPKEKPFFYIPRKTFDEIKAIEKQALFINAICLLHIAYHCITSIKTIRLTHNDTPALAINHIYRINILTCALETFLFLVGIMYFLFWKPVIRLYQADLSKRKIGLFTPIYQHSLNLRFDGHPIRIYFSAIILYAILEEGCFHLLPEGWYLNYLSETHISMAFTIFVIGILAIHRNQHKHLTELENKLKIATQSQ